MAKHKIRAGIVGLGQIGRTHAAILRDHPEIDLVGAADPAHQARDRFRSEFGLEAVGTLDELLVAPGLDAVFVCSPNAVHPAQTKKALAAGALVLCETPPAKNVGQAKEMAAAAEGCLTTLHRRGRFPSASGNLLHGLVYRHTLQPFRSHLGPGALGEVTSVDAIWERSRGVPASRALTDRDAAGGGAGMIVGIHVLDLAWWALGCPRPLWVQGRSSNLLARTTEVRGKGGYDPAQFDVEDTLVGAIGFEETELGKPILNLRAALAANIPGSLGEQAGIVLRGSRSTFDFSVHTGDSVPWAAMPRTASERRGALESTRIWDPPPLTVQQGRERQVQHVVDVLRGDAEPIVTPGQAVTLMGMIDSLYETAGTPRNDKGPIRLDKDVLGPSGDGDGAQFD